jgi:hypothetical protein
LIVVFVGDTEFIELCDSGEYCGVVTISRLYARACATSSGFLSAHAARGSASVKNSTTSGFNE